MVYDWDGKEPLLRQLYLDDKLTMEEVIQFMKDNHDFTASKRAYQAQFKRWGFRSKQNPAHHNAPLVAAIQGLWEKNVGQKEMHRILTDEMGFEINERELMRTRGRYNMMMRVPNGTKDPLGVVETGESELMTDDGSEMDGEHDGEHDGEQQQSIPLSSAPEGNGALFKKAKTSTASKSPAVLSRLSTSTRRRAPTPELDPEVLAKRQERQRRKQAESDELWAQKKRRRRTRDRAGLPADPPCPPRFPSETTIDEAKAFLHLDDTHYQQMRDSFTDICNGLRIVKKSEAGHDGWQAAKDRLIFENAHLSYWCLDRPSPDGREALAVDIICSDVTKRIRTMASRMTIAEAKNALGINPEESRQVRQGFYDILRGDHFTSKIEAGKEHWDELKEQWIAGLPILQGILAPGDADPQHGLKVKAMEILCRDVMKRLRDDQANRDPSRKKLSQGQTNRTVATPRARGRPPTNHYVASGGVMADDAGMSTLASQALATSMNLSQPQTVTTASDYANQQIDPELLASSHHLSSHLVPAAPSQPTPASPPLPPPLSARPMSIPLGVFFQTSPKSSIQVSPPVWLTTMTSFSLADIQSTALEEHPDPELGQNFRVIRVEGVLESREGAGRQITMRLDSDDEVGAYLKYLEGDKIHFWVSFGEV